MSLGVILRIMATLAASFERCGQARNGVPRRMPSTKQQAFSCVATERSKGHATWLTIASTATWRAVGRRVGRTPPGARPRANQQIDHAVALHSAAHLAAFKAAFKRGMLPTSAYRREPRAMSRHVLGSSASGHSRRKNLGHAGPSMSRTIGRQLAATNRILGLRAWLLLPITAANCSTWWHADWKGSASRRAPSSRCFRWLLGGATRSITTWGGPHSGSCLDSTGLFTLSSSTRVPVVPSSLGGRLAAADPALNVRICAAMSPLRSVPH